MGVVLQKEEEYNKQARLRHPQNANRLPQRLSLGSRGCANEEQAMAHFN